MKYSEAIRLGSMLGPQGFGGSEGGVALCANQAARAAIGFKGCTIYMLGAGTQRDVPCPVCSTVDMLAGVIACCLNDRHRWTREQIADWLAASGHDFEIDLRPKAAPVEEPVAAGVVA